MIFNAHFCKLLRHVKFSAVTLQSHVISHTEKNPILLLLLQSSSVRCFSSDASDDQQSFIVTRLVNNYGLSPKSAFSASKHLPFENLDRVDSVISFFKSHGFSNTQITSIIHKRPLMLRSDPEKTLLPKIKFFHSKGFSSLDIFKLVYLRPEILHRSLEKQIIPAFDVIKTLFPSHNDSIVISAIKLCPEILLPQLELYVLPNIKMLQENGLPESSIAWFLKFHPRSLLTRSDRLGKVVEEVKGMGINPLQIHFAVAVYVRNSTRESTWKRKSLIYRKWGWSEEEILVAFRKYPHCMLASDEKIMKMMDFYVNKMGWNSSSIANYPLLILYSLEKRVVPRCCVIQVLQSKGLIRLTSIATPLSISEKLFLRKYVTPYAEEAPQLLELYQEKMKLAK